MSRTARDDEDVRAEVLRGLAEAAGSKTEGREISVDDSLENLVDSLDAILLVLDLEERLAIDVDDNELSSLRTVGALLELVEAKCRAAETDQA